MITRNIVIINKQSETSANNLRRCNLEVNNSSINCKSIFVESGSRESLSQSPITGQTL